jgi:hypothetical protein
MTVMRASRGNTKTVPHKRLLHVARQSQANTMFLILAPTLDAKQTMSPTGCGL